MLTHWFPESSLILLRSPQKFFAWSYVSWILRSWICSSKLQKHTIPRVELMLILRGFLHIETLYAAVILIFFRPQSEKRWYITERNQRFLSPGMTPFYKMHWYNRDTFYTNNNFLCKRNLHANNLAWHDKALYFLSLTVDGGYPPDLWAFFFETCKICHCTISWENPQYWICLFSGDFEAQRNIHNWRQIVNKNVYSKVKIMKMVATTFYTYRQFLNSHFQL